MNCTQDSKKHPLAGRKLSHVFESAMRTFAPNMGEAAILDVMLGLQRALGGRELYVPEMPTAGQEVQAVIQVMVDARAGHVAGTEGYARRCMDLLGRKVRASHGSEHWSFAKDQDEIGEVVDVYIHGLDRAMVVVRFLDGDHTLGLIDIVEGLQ